jgi:hypothetical protein
VIPVQCRPTADKAPPKRRKSARAAIGEPITFANNRVRGGDGRRRLIYVGKPAAALLPSVRPASRQPDHRRISPGALGSISDHEWVSGPRGASSRRVVIGASAGSPPGRSAAEVAEVWDAGLKGSPAAEVRKQAAMRKRGQGRDPCRILGGM